MYLKGLTGMRDLDLARATVTDAGLMNLRQMTKLEKLDLTGTKVTDEGVKELQKALPNCQIQWKPPATKADR